MYFPVRQEPHWLLRVDILHCIAYSLLIALPITAGLARKPHALKWVAAALAAAVFALSPFAEHVAAPWGNFVNSHTSVSSMFPLAPWAGYVYLGASAGALAATGDVKALVRWIAGIAAIGFVAWQLGPRTVPFYPEHDYWVTNPGNHGERWFIVCCVVLAMLAAELKLAGTWRTSPPVRFIEVFGMSSLAAYFLHETLLYYRLFGFPFFAMWGKSCGWAKYALLSLLLIVSAWVLTWVTDKVYKAMGQQWDRGVAFLKARTSTEPAAAE
jgi:uncharacterized membrane protein